MRVSVDASTLSIGGDSYTLPPALKDRFPVLEPDEQLLAWAYAGVRGDATTLISTSPGLEAGDKLEWLMQATKTTHRRVTIDPTMTIEALTGGLRPGPDGRIRPESGPLTEMLEEGGVLIVDAAHLGDRELLSRLKTLAEGATRFDHPKSGQVLDVHPDFRLVLVTETSRQTPRPLQEIAESLATTTHVRGYDEEEHVRLLVDRHGLDANMASKVARFHESVVTAEGAGDIDYGRTFPLTWALLDRVGARLSQSDDPGDAEIASAVHALYSARLTRPEDIAALNDLLDDAGLGEPEAPTTPKTSRDYVDMPETSRALGLANEALDYRETVLLNAPGQAGATRLAEQLAKGRKQKLVTVVGHSGLDPQGLMERFQFNEDGTLKMIPGVIADALTKGNMLYLDHLDQLPPERQATLLRLMEIDSIPVVENGKIVQKEIHPDARVVASITHGVKDPARKPPESADRARTTEIFFDRPQLDDALKVASKHVSAETLDAVTELAVKLHAEDPDRGLLKLQRTLDFARATELFAEHMPVDQAATRAAKMLFGPQGKVLKKRDDGPDLDPPLWSQLMGVTEAEIEERLEPTGYRLVPSMEQHLEPLAVAYLLGRPVLAVGPASSGKTVLGAVWAAIVEKPNIRQNFSAATESRDLKGGLSPVNVGGRTVFKHVEGPEFQAAAQEAVYTADEWNLSREALMSLKTWVDYRREARDPDVGEVADLGSSFLYAAQNPVGTRGRNELPPTISDCMFHIVVDAKPTEEKVDIVASQSDLAENYIGTVARFFEDLDVLAQRNIKKHGRAFKSSIGPVTCTERDMLKVADTVHYLAQRDGVTSEDGHVELLGREMVRSLRDIVLDDGERELVRTLVEKHIRADYPAFKGEVAGPERPTTIERVTVDVDGTPTEMLQIGVARFPIRPPTGDPEVDGLVPDKSSLGEPVGEQFEFLESVLLAIELNQPVAIVGATGTGKTMQLMRLAAEVGAPFMEQAFHADMTTGHLFGTEVITEDGRVEFQLSPLDNAAISGAWYNGDELLTLPNETRESLNPVNEGAEIQIPSRPRRVLKKKTDVAEDRWHEDFRVIYTTNGDDIREDGFSDPEASRLRLVGLRQLRKYEDLLTIGLRDYASSSYGKDYEAPVRNEENREASALALSERFDGRSALAKLLKKVAAGETIENDELETLLAQDVDFSDEFALEMADFLNSFSYAKKDAPVRELATFMGNESVQAEVAAKVGALVPDNLLPQAISDVAFQAPLVDGRIANPREVEQATDLFCQLRELQESSKGEVVSPLTPRLFTSFLEFYREKRARSSSPLAAAARAAELTLFSKLPGQQRKALRILLDVYGRKSLPEEEFEVPKQAGRFISFTDTVVEAGPETLWAPNNARFPMTPARIKNLSLTADAFELGLGRPMSAIDDDNGETVEMLREFGRVTGKRVTVVQLPPGVEIEPLIERLALTDNPDVKSGLEPELQQIGQAILEGHILVLRGCGNVPSNKLERLNSLADGRRYLLRPNSNQKLEAPQEFRMVLMRRPDSPHRYSPALENRVIEPLLTTADADLSDDALTKKAAELAAVVHKRVGISTALSLKLAVFHTYLNQKMRDGAFTGGRMVGSFLNRDAESVARRLKYLQDREAVHDDLEMLHYLITQIYAERFPSPTDRLLLDHILQNPQCLGTEGDKVALDTTLTPSQHLMRFGEWAAPRDPKGVRPGVPGPEAILPEPMPEPLADAHLKAFAALQFEETLHLSGDSFVADAVVKSICRLTTSPLVEQEGNEELNEASLFGGLVQNDDGKFENYEGLVWEAQRNGGTLYIRNADRLPKPILSRLEEIAATGEVQRVHNGKLEVQSKNFRLILQTTIKPGQSGGGSGFQRSTSNIDAECTRVRCEPLTERRDLVAMVRHMLLGIPGGKEAADVLVKFGLKMSDIMSAATMTGRPRVRFDTSRLLRMATQIAERAQEGKQPLETVIADAVSTWYVAPTVGMEVEDRVHDAAEKIGDKIYGDSGALVAEMPDPVDIVANPQLASLKRDYDEVRNSFGQEVWREAASALADAVSSKKLARTDAVVTALLDSEVFPASFKTRLAKIQSQWEGASRKTLTDDVRTALEKAIAVMEKNAKGETTFSGDALTFLRGARMWDLEHRLEILDTYRSLFETLKSEGADGAGARTKDLDQVRERFDTASALSTVQSVRDQVQTAFEAYRAREGDTDASLANGFRRAIERWDLVSTTPIFKSHHLLRTELLDLRTEIESFAKAHPGGGKKAEVAGLVDAVHQATELLEGVRLAEQSADLRRELAKGAADTRSLVTMYRDEVFEVKRLSEAKKDHEVMTTALQYIDTVSGGGDYLKMDLQGVAVDRPSGTPEAELRKKADTAARSDLAAELTIKRRELAMELQTMAGTAPKAGGFFDNVSGADVGRQLDAPNKPSKSEIQTRYEAGMKEINAWAKEEIKDLAEGHYEDLKAADERKVEADFARLLKNRSIQLASSIKRSGGTLFEDLKALDANLDLKNARPELSAAITEVGELLDDAASKARIWSQNYEGFMASAGRGLMQVVTLGFYRPEVPPPPPEIESSKKRAAEVLAQVRAYVTGELKELPTFDGIDTHKERADGLKDELLLAENLGDTASRFATLAKLAGEEADNEVQAILKTVLGRLSSDKDARAMLVRLHAFSDSADALSSEMAAQTGVNVEVAPVVEAVMRAARTVRQQSLSNRGLTVALRALEQAEQRITELELAMGILPQTIGIVREELQALDAAVRTVADQSGALETQDAEVGAMLAGLSRQNELAKAEDFDELVAASMTYLPPSEVAASGEKAFQETVDEVSQVEERLEWLERPVRSAELEVLSVDFVRAQKSADATPKAKDEVKNDKVLLDRVNDQLELFAGRGEHAHKQLEKASFDAKDALDALEVEQAQSVLQAQAPRLEGLNSVLAKVCDGTDGPYRGVKQDVGVAVRELRLVTKSLAGLETVPDDLVSELRGAVESARKLGGHCHGGQG